MSEKKKSGGQFWINLLMIVIVMLIKTFALDGLIGTLLRTVITGNDDASLILSNLLLALISSVVCGIILAILLYKRVENDGEERRFVLEYFQERPVDKANIKACMKANRDIRRNAIAYLAALLVFLTIKFVPSILDIGINFAIMAGIYWIVVIRGCHRLYRQWDAERLHR